jgi:hypothetical protein
MRVIWFRVQSYSAESSRRVLVIDFLFLEQNIDVINDVVMILLVSLFDCSPISTVRHWIIFIEIGCLIVIYLRYIIKLDFL